MKRVCQPSSTNGFFSPRLKKRGFWGYYVQICIRFMRLRYHYSPVILHWNRQKVENFIIIQSLAPFQPLSVELIARGGEHLDEKYFLTYN